jgi:hypothetical protein
MILQFCKLNDDPDDPTQMHIPIRYAWQEAPDDLHIQFDNENFFPAYDKSAQVYLVRHKNEILRFGHISFQEEPSKGSELLLKSDFEKFWFSPNLTYVTAVVNNRDRSWLENTLMTHADAVLLNRPDRKYKEDEYIVKYKGADGPKPNGTMVRGDAIQIGKTPILLTVEKIN